MADQISLTMMLKAAGALPRSRAAMAAAVREKRFQAGEDILRQGEVSADVYVLKSGLAKLVYITPEGKEFVKSFIAEGHVVGSLASLINGSASTFSITCLEACHVEAAAYENIRLLSESDPAVLRFSCMLFQQLALKKEIREHDFLCLTPAERYAKFLHEQPGLVGRISQIEIAHYLGITPVALSRIKSRLKQEEGSAD